MIPESPRYLILTGKEEKAKKVLAWIARVNCRPPLSGRLVTQEEKEQLLQESGLKYSSDRTLKVPVTSLVGCSGEARPAVKEASNYGTLPNMEESVNSDQLADRSSVNESEMELSSISEGNMHEQNLSCKEIINKRLVTYYQWFLILFKNGYWKTTLLLWYLW